MTPASTWFCDRCGCTPAYISLKGTNGMIAWGADVCKTCFGDVKAMMLNANNRYRKPDDDPQ